MEWTKEKLERTCILVTGKSQGEKVLDFYISFGFKRLYTAYDITKGVYLYTKDGFIMPLYGIYKTAKINSNTIIKLPSRPRSKFPREMMVSDDKITWYKRAVIVNTKSIKQYIALKAPYNINDMPIGNQYKGWRYAKEID